MDSWLRLTFQKPWGGRMRQRSLFTCCWQPWRDVRQLQRNLSVSQGSAWCKEISKEDSALSLTARQMGFRIRSISFDIEAWRDQQGALHLPIISKSETQAPTAMLQARKNEPIHEELLRLLTLNFYVLLGSEGNCQSEHRCHSWAAWWSSTRGQKKMSSPCNDGIIWLSR